MGPVKELRQQVKVVFGVLATLLFFCCLKAELNIEKAPSPIKALLGNNVTLPCVLTRDNNQELDLDLFIVGIRWKKIYSDGSEIDVYKFLNLNHTQIRPGSFIDERELRRGNASLTLHHVQRSDEGEYTCTIFVTPNKAWTKIKVQLLAQPNVTLSNIELTVEIEDEKSITCEVNKYYPEVVKIRWVKYSKSSGNRSSLDNDTYFTVPKLNSDGTFSVTSLLTVRPSSLGETGDSYSCNVTHESFNHDQDVRFTLIVTEPTISNWVIILITLILFVILICIIYFIPASPKVSDITGLDDLAHDKSSTLSCMVSGFKPRNIKIQFCLKRVGDCKEYEIDSWIYPIPTVQHNDTVDYSGGQEESQPLNIHKNEPSKKNFKTLKTMRSYFAFNCLCSTHITPDKEKDEGAELIIKVEHFALKSPLIICQKLKITGDFLRLSPIKAPQHLKPGEEVTLTCEIFKCNRKPLHVTWLKEDVMKEKPTVVIHEKGKTNDVKYRHEQTAEEEHGRVLRSSSSIIFTVQVKEDHGARYICMVQYPAIRQTSQSFQETFVTAIPVLEPIRCSHAVHCVGQQMELSCRIHSFSPKSLIAEWYKEDEKLPSPDYKILTGEDGLYSTTSILNYIPKMEDNGKVFMCKVDHQSFTEPITHKWKLEELSKWNRTEPALKNQGVEGLKN